ncbi:hypothetical protein Nepgr_024705 [Nepenthes gracilis]|uniref:Uncharacterized protein n=1 Tax=Nepenthes gracilis TaxID=150966 RepID=A0AAD3T6F7_NEPGR|nr:hypothetical protein Nepgr_024705 [Nepenthes gracilis]
MGPIPSKISIKADEDVLAKDVIVVDYQWKPKHQGNGRPANQKITSKSTAAKQAVVNLNPDVVSVTSTEPEASNAFEKVPVDSISISPKEKVEILVNSMPASGSEIGPISLPLQADVNPLSDPDAVGSVADSLGLQFEPMTLFKSSEGNPVISPTRSPNGIPLDVCSDLTPNSIARITRKYHLDQSDLDEEPVKSMVFESGVHGFRDWPCPETKIQSVGIFGPVLVCFFQKD